MSKGFLTLVLSFCFLLAFSQAGKQPLWTLAQSPSPGSVIISDLSNYAEWTVPSIRILYVSPGGNNTKAVRGNPLRPWQTIEGARAIAVSGDLILVTPGSYTPAAGLHKNGITYYFTEGAKVTTNGASLFSVPNGETLTVRGNGVFTCTNEFIFSVGNAVAPASKLFFEANKIVDNRANTCIFTFGRFIVDAKVDTIIQNVDHLFHNASSGTVPNNSFFRLKSNYVSLLCGVSSNRFQFTASTAGNITYEIDFKELISTGGQSTTHAVIFAGPSGTVTNYNLDVKIGTVRSNAINGYPTVIINSSKTAWTNSTAKVIIDRFIGTGANSAIISGGTLGNGTNSTLWVNIGEYTGTAATAIGGGFGQVGTESQAGTYYINANINNTAGIGYRLSNRVKAYVSGRFITGNNAACISITGGAGLGSNTVMEGVTLINDATAATLTSGVVTTAVIKKSYTNTLIIDPNITELVDGFTRDASVK
jgi:hypothetical protein